MKKVKFKESLADAFKPKKGWAKTFRLVRNFCITQVMCLVIAIVCSFGKYYTYAVLAILAEIFEWRFFSLSLRLRKYEEKDE